MQPGLCTLNASLDDTCPFARRFDPARHVPGGSMLRRRCPGNAVGADTVLDVQRKLERVIAPHNARDRIEHHTSPGQMGSWLHQASLGVREPRRVCETRGGWWGPTTTSPSNVGRELSMAVGVRPERAQASCARSAARTCARWLAGRLPAGPRASRSSSIRQRARLLTVGELESATAADGHQTRHRLGQSATRTDAPVGRWPTHGMWCLVRKVEL